MTEQMTEPAGGDEWKPELTWPGTAMLNILHLVKEITLVSPWLQGEELTRRRSDLEGGH